MAPTRKDNREERVARLDSMMNQLPAEHEQIVARVKRARERTRTLVNRAKKAGAKDS